MVGHVGECVDRLITSVLINVPNFDGPVDGVCRKQAISGLMPLDADALASMCLQLQIALYS